MRLPAFAAEHAAVAHVGLPASMADTVYAPVVAGFLIDDLPLPPACRAYCQTNMTMPEMVERVAAATHEPEEIEDLDMDF